MTQQGHHRIGGRTRHPRLETNDRPVAACVFSPAGEQERHRLQIIAATIEAGLINTDKKVSGSRKFVRYLLFWVWVSFKGKPFDGLCSHDIYLIDKRLLI